MSRWVQHISGQGEKWEVRDGYNPLSSNWSVYGKHSAERHYLPKSEYRECPPPRRRVTGEMQVSHTGTLIHKDGGTRASFHGTVWKLLRKEDLADGEVCLVIEEGE